MKHKWLSVWKPHKTFGAQLVLVLNMNGRNKARNQRRKQEILEKVEVV